MTISRVLPLHDGDQFSGQQDYNTVTRKYLVETDGSLEDYEIVPTAIGSGLLPDVGALLDNSYDYRARTLDLEFTGNRKNWIAIATYDNRPTNDVSNLQQQTESFNPENPELDPVVFNLSSREVRQPVLFDTYGRPVINGAGDLLDPGIEAVYTNVVVEAEANVLEPEDWTVVVNTTNEYDCTVFGQFIPRHRGLVTSSKTSGPNFRYKQLPAIGGPTANTRIPIEYYKINLEIEISDRPVPQHIEFIELYRNGSVWDWRIVDVENEFGGGMPWKEFNSNTGTRKTINQDNPTLYNAATDYVLGQPVYYTTDPNGNPNDYRYWCVQAHGPASVGAKTPGSGVNYDFWRPYAAGQSGPVKMQILNGDLDPFSPADVRFSPIDTPVWLYNDVVNGTVDIKRESDPYQFVINDLYEYYDWRIYNWAAN